MPSQKSKVKKSVTVKKCVLDYKAVFNMVDDAVVIHDIKTGCVIDANDKYLKMRSIKKKDLPFISIKDYSTGVFGYSEKQAMKFIKAACRGKPQIFEWAVLKKNGAVAWVEVNLKKASINNRGVLIGVVRNINERKETEVRLNESENRFRELFNNIHSGVAVYEISNNGKDFIFKDINKSGQLIDKVKKKDVIGRGVLELFPSVKKFGLFKVFQEVYKTGVPKYHPVSFYKDNRIAGWRNNYVYKLSSGELAAVYEDITEQKKNEQFLEESEERFRIIIENIPYGVLVHDLDGNIFMANKASSRNTGYSMQELLTMKIKDIDVASETRKDKEKIWRKLKRKESIYINSIHKRKDGSVYPAEICLSAVVLNEKPVLLSITQDITERKKREQQIQKELQQLLSIFNSMDEIIYVSDPDTYELLFFNAKAQELFGDYMGKKCYEVLQKKDAPCDFCTNKKIFGKYLGNTCIWEFQNRKTHRWFRCIDRAIEWSGGKYVRFEMAVDITERKKAEEALYKIREDLINAQRIANVGSWEWDVATGKVAWSDEVYRIFKVDPKKFKPEIDSVLKFLYEDEQDSGRKAVDNLINTPGSVSYERRFIRADGSEGYYLSTFEGEYDKKGQLLRIVGVVHDITKRKKIENALVEEEAKFRAIFEQAAVGVALIETETGKFMRVNEKYCQILGYEKDKMISYVFQEEVHSDDLRDELENMKQLYQGTLYSFNMQKRYFKKDGNLVWVNLTVSSMWHKGEVPDYHIVVIEDITERKKAEEVLKRDKETFEKLVKERTNELVQAQEKLQEARRLADIGALATTVAHELRNPLGVIKAAVYNITVKKKDAQLDKHLANIQKKIDESDKIINNLLGYSRIKVPDYEDIIICEILEECIGFFEEKFKEKGILVNKDINISKDMKIEGDPVQLKEIFSNIIDNAYNAISDIGTAFTVSVCKSGKNELKIEFKDDGGGIAEENIDKLFEPFFTTRAKGTGLGLTICKELVEMHKGRISINNGKKKGAVVVVAIPVSKPV